MGNNLDISASVKNQPQGEALETIFYQNILKKT
jgi:hypothetical protein